MAPIEQFRNLKQRKQALLLESELNRLVLRLEVERFRASTARIDASIAKARRLGPWMVPLISVLGFLAGRRARHGSSKSGWFKVALHYLPLLLRLGRQRTASE